MYTILLVVHVIITLAMIAIILLQRSSTDGLGGMGGGAGGGFMTTRGQANLLTRTTAILATVFIVNSMALSWLTQQDAPSRSIADKIIEQSEELEVPAPQAGDTGLPADLPEAQKKTDVDVPQPE